MDSKSETEADLRVEVARRRGRGTASNRTGRFERLARAPVDDGWTRDEELPPIRTEVAIDRGRSIIARNQSPDVPFDRSINPYRGCEHGCVYCFARPSHAFLGLSPGLDFETRLTAKPDAARLLRRELSKRGYRPAVLAIGTNTDPYQPIDRDYRVMRQVLEVLRDFRHPVAITTKGAHVLRDADILARMAADGLAQVTISVTTLDHRLARSMEPRAAGPRRRLQLLRGLSAAGVPVSVNVSPIVPGLTDHEMEGILEASAEAGARSAAYTTLRLPREVSPLVQDWLAREEPGKAARVMARVREMHGGQDYDAQWGLRMRGEGPFADMLAQRFGAACRRLGLAQGRGWAGLRTDLFRVPEGDGPAAQLSLDL